MMSEHFDIIEYFKAAPAGEPDVVLGSIAALVAKKSCSIETCELSTACNPFAKLARYQRRARLGECSTCYDEVATHNTYNSIMGEGNHDNVLDPEIIDIDPVSPGSFMRKPAIAGMEAFWEKVDAAVEPNAVFDLEGRREIAAVIRTNYGDILSE